MHPYDVDPNGFLPLLRQLADSLCSRRVTRARDKGGMLNAAGIPLVETALINHGKSADLHENGLTRRTAMTLREWRGRVPHEKVDAYLEVLEQTGLKQYAATPGHLETWVLLDREGEVAEFTLLTLWRSREVIQRFAGEDIGRAVYYPEDDGYLLDKPERLRHYEVLRKPGN